MRTTDCHYEYELQNSLRLVLSDSLLSIQLKEVPMRRIRSRVAGLDVHRDYVFVSLWYLLIEMDRRPPERTRRSEFWSSYS